MKTNPAPREIAGLATWLLRAVMGPGTTEPRQKMRETQVEDAQRTQETQQVKPAHRLGLITQARS